MRYSTNTSGDLALIGNSQMSCPESHPDCAKARSAEDLSTSSEDKPWLNNNHFNMQYVDVDSDAGTFNSSSADLDLPAQAEVLFAGLYWGGWHATPQPANKSTIKLGVNADAYTSITAKAADVRSLGSTYSAFADVTNIVKAEGSGSYTVADIRLSLNSIYGHGGWAMVVAYQAPGEPMRALRVYNGLNNIGATDTLRVEVGNMLAPDEGLVRTKVGVVAGEGDRGSSGDYLKINDQPLSDSTHPADNFALSEISDLGVRQKRSPGHVNTLGWDVSRIKADGLVANGARSASIEAGSAFDWYVLHVLTFSTELNAPSFAGSSSKSASKSTAKPGDEIQYSVTVRNTGGSSARDVIVEDVLPTGTTYVPDSLSLISSSGPVSIGRQAMTDTGFRVDLGVMPANGDPKHLVYRLKAKDDFLGTLRNTATITATDSTGAIDISEVLTHTVDVTAPKADLLLWRSAAPKITAGKEFRYGISVENYGPERDPGPFRVQEKITSQSKVRILGFEGKNWDCVATPDSAPVRTHDWTCDYTKPLVADQETPRLWVNAITPSNTPDGSAIRFLAQARSSLGTDIRPENNTNTSEEVVTTSADLSIATTHNAVNDEVFAGDSVSYRMVLSNDGPSDTAGPPAILVTPGTGIKTLNFEGLGWTCTKITNRYLCTNAQSNLKYGENAPDLFAHAVIEPAHGGAFTLESVASISALEDPDMTNNKIVTTLTAVEGPDLAVGIAQTDPLVAGGAEAPFAVRTSNLGPSTLPAGSLVRATVHIPTGMRVSSASGDGWSCNGAPWTGPATINCSNALESNVAPDADMPDLVLNARFGPGSDATVPVRADISSPGDPNASNDTVTDDLSITASSDLGVAVKQTQDAQAGGFGGQVIYVVTNNGPSADNGPITALVPDVPGLTLNTFDDWACTNAGGLNECTYTGSLAAGAKVELGFRVQAATETALGVKPVRLTVIGSQDPEPSNNQTTAAVGVKSTIATMLEMTTASPTLVPGRDNVKFLIKVGNTDGSGNLKLVNKFGEQGYTFVGLTNTMPGSCTHTATTLTCDYSFYSNRTDEIELELAPAADASGTISNTATVYPGGRTATASVTVTPESELELTHEVVDLSAGEPMIPESDYEYALNVRNTGPSPAGGVTLTSTLPDGVTYLSATGEGWTCSATAPVSCTHADAVASGASYPELLLSVYVEAGATGNLTASASAQATTGGDPAPAQVTHPTGPARPGRPSLDISAGNGTVTVEPAKSTTGGPVDEFRVDLTPGAGTCTVTPPEQSCTVRGLTNGTHYRATVTAVNASGRATSEPSDPVIPLAPPGRPGKPEVVAGDTRALIVPTLPTTGGPAMLYTVTAKPGDATCTVPSRAIGCVIGGLTNGTEYSFTVTATNASGTSEASPAQTATPVTPMAAPNVPGRPTAKPGNQSAIVTVTPPTGGDVVDNYTVTAAPGGGTCEVEAPATSCMVTGLTNFAEYTFTVTAHNAVGTSTASPPSAPIRPGLPSVPAGIEVTPGNKPGELVVTVPPGTGGGTLETIIVTATTGTGDPGTCAIKPPQTSCVLTGLLTDAEYTITAVAINSGGDGGEIINPTVVTPDGWNGCVSTTKARWAPSAAWSKKKLVLKTGKQQKVPFEVSPPAARQVEVQMRTGKGPWTTTSTVSTNAQGKGTGTIVGKAEAKRSKFGWRLNVLPSPASESAAMGGAGASKMITYVVKPKAKSAKGKLSKTAALTSYDSCKASTVLAWTSKPKLGKAKKVVAGFEVKPSGVRDVTVEFRQGKGPWRAASKVKTSADGKGSATLLKKKPAASWRLNAAPGPRENQSYGRVIKLK